MAVQERLLLAGQLLNNHGTSQRVEKVLLVRVADQAKWDVTYKSKEVKEMLTTNSLGLRQIQHLHAGGLPDFVSQEKPLLLKVYSTRRAKMRGFHLPPKATRHNNPLYNSGVTFTNFGLCFLPITGDLAVPEV